MKPISLFVGIDIGADRLHVCARAADQSPKSAQVLIVDMSDARWFESLAFIQPGDLVALEPTGWHYSAAIVRYLTHQGARVVQVEHRTTPKIRSLFVSDVKNDKTDARALALAARSYPAFGGMHAHQEVEHRDAVTGLRFLIHDHQRAVQTTTRSTNRLRQLTRAVWPSLSASLNVYLRAAKHGYITPADLRQLAAIIDDLPNATTPTRNTYKHGNTRVNLHALVETLPDWLDDTPLADTILREVDRLQTAELAQTAIDQSLTDVINKPPFAEITELWCGVPGWSTIAIAALHVATSGNAGGLTQAQFKAAVGSHPHISQSGETSEAAAARQGFRPAKTTLYLWTMQLIQQGGNSVSAAYLRHKTDPKRKYNINAARGQLCTILSAIARYYLPYNPERQNMDIDHYAKQRLEEMWSRAVATSAPQLPRPRPCCVSAQALWDSDNRGIIRIYVYSTGFCGQYGNL